MIGTLGFNPHSPGAIGDVTPATLAGTTLSLTSTGAPQIVAAYDINNQLQVSIASNGNPTINALCSNWNNWVWSINGIGIVAWNPGVGMQLQGLSAQYGFNGATAAAGHVHYAFPGGGGMGGSGANLVSVLPDGLNTTVTFGTTLTTISTGIQNSSLPTADPHAAGRWWSNAGVVTISAG